MIVLNAILGLFVTIVLVAIVMTIFELIRETTNNDY